jgi:hypothetical protein
MALLSMARQSRVDRAHTMQFKLAPFDNAEQHILRHGKLAHPSDTDCTHPPVHLISALFIARHTSGFSKDSRASLER